MTHVSRTTKNLECGARKLLPQLMCNASIHLQSLANPSVLLVKVPAHARSAVPRAFPQSDRITLCNTTLDFVRGEHVVEASNYQEISNTILVIVEVKEGQGHRFLRFDPAELSPRCLLDMDLMLVGKRPTDAIHTIINGPASQENELNDNVIQFLAKDNVFLYFLGGFHAQQ